MECHIDLQLFDGRSAESVLGAVAPESRAVPSHRTEISMRRNGNHIFLDIESEDVTSMRAAVNSYCRWLILAREMTEYAGDD